MNETRWQGTEMRVCADRIEGSRGLMFEHQVVPRPNHLKEWLVADDTPRPTRVGPMWTMPVRVDKWFVKHISPAGDCWEWTGAKTRNGYGQLRIAGVPFMAHRAMFEYFVADIPTGLDLDHLCRNRACVNPWHMEPVTRSVNLRRGHTTRAHNSSKTHCPHGHPYSAENTRISAQGKRNCRTCERLRAADKRRAVARGQD